MLSLLSKTWELDRAAAEKEFVNGTISPEDEDVLRRSITTEQWFRLRLLVRSARDRKDDFGAKRYRASLRDRAKQAREMMPRRLRCG